jgi:nucleoside phosphorylase
VSEQCDVILVFVNDNEKNAVYNAFKERQSRDPVVKFGEVLTYHDFGSIGGAKVLGLQIEMGSTTRGGSSAALPEAIKETTPQYVILVGIAFGMDRKKQGLGDVLVSNKLALYEMRRIGTNKKGEDVEIKRGDTAAASERILGKFRAWSSANHWQEAPVHFGLMVSGEKLIDNAQFKKKLTIEYPEAIGGEMEAAGAYVTAEFYKRDWIVVKAVCDYADGTKKHNKQKNQELAAKNAAQLVFHVLEHGNFGGVFLITGKKEKKEKEKGTSSKAEIKKKVTENIIKLLEKKKMKHFRQALKNRLNEENNETEQFESHQMAAILINKSVLEAVSTLNVALKKCIEDIEDIDGDDDLIDRTWTDSVNILGWLVLLGVDDEWAKKTVQYMAEKEDSLELIIPVKTVAGVEIAVSRLKETKAILDRDKITYQVKGEQSISCDQWSNIEVGWDIDDKVIMIKTALWKTLIKQNPPGSGEFTKDMDTELNETILAKKEMGEYHYIAVDRSCQYHPLLEKQVYTELIKDLPSLEIFFIQKDDREVAIIGESQLHARLRLFFDNKPG